MFEAVGSVGEYEVHALLSREKQVDDKSICVELWKETSEAQRHFDSVYWHAVRYYTGLLVLTAGGAGASLGLSAIPDGIRVCLSALILLLGALLAYVASRVADAQGFLIGVFQKSQSLAELNLLNSIELDEPIRKEWLKNRGLEEDASREPSKGKVRVIVVLSFRVICAVLVAAAILLLVISPQMTNTQASDKHVAHCEVAQPPNQQLQWSRDSVTPVAAPPRRQRQAPLS